MTTDSEGKEQMEWRHFKVKFSKVNYSVSMKPLVVSTRRHTDDCGTTVLASLSDHWQCNINSETYDYTCFICSAWTSDQQTACSKKSTEYTQFIVDIDTDLKNVVD